jgi:hypothetical protein
MSTIATIGAVIAMLVAYFVVVNWVTRTDDDK